MLPSGWVFIIMCIVLRLIEGVGSALFMTGALAIVPQLYPDSVGRVTVSNNLLMQSIFAHEVNRSDCV